MRPAALLTALLAAACGGAPETPGPPEVLYGAEECDRCRMIVSEPSYAAAARTSAGEELRFDDIGCLVRSLEREGANGWSLWVHDHPSGAWLAAGDAVFVASPGLATPMGYGLAAFALRAEAERFGREHEGAVLAWPEVRARSRDGTPAERLTNQEPQD